MGENHFYFSVNHIYLDMDISELKKLIRLFENSKITELEIEQKNARVRLKKGRGQKPAQESAPPVEPVAPVQADTALPEKVSDHHVIAAPMVGAFFRAPSPGSPSFVEEGDTVRKGQVLCVIEAMKLMNEIESEVAGKIAKIYPENGKPVEFGEKLFDIEFI